MKRILELLWGVFLTLYVSVAVITGPTDGIGKAFAFEVFCEEIYRSQLYFTDRVMCWSFAVSI